MDTSIKSLNHQRLASGPGSTSAVEPAGGLDKFHSMFGFPNVGDQKKKTNTWVSKDSDSLDLEDSDDLECTNIVGNLHVTATWLIC